MRLTYHVLTVCLLTIAVVVSGVERVLNENPEKDAVTDSATNDNKDTANTAESLEKSSGSDSECNESSEKVNYDGLKVLRVVTKTKEQKKWVKGLDERGVASIWSSNGTAIDILVRNQDVIDEIKNKSLAFDVVIENLQQAIEEENPPLSEEEWSELEGRKEENEYPASVNPFWEFFNQWWNRGVTIANDNDDDEAFVGLRKLRKKGKAKKPIRRHRMTWQMYHRLDDINGFMDYLAATYPKNVSIERIGSSVEGRPLRVLKISSGRRNSPVIWVDSGIHAREWISPATTTYILSQMLENGDGMHGVDWLFSPVLNPDGYEYSHLRDRLWRKNRSKPRGGSWFSGSCYGTDLNRNFGYKWGGMGSSQDPCKETYAGTGPFSEPETNAINSFILKHAAKIKAYISFHSYGQYILYPWGYDRKVPPDYADLHRAGRAMADAIMSTSGQSYRVGAAAATLYPAAGGSDDWAKGTARIKYAYTIELRDTGKHGFILPAQYIVPTAREAYAALKVIAKEVRAL